MKELRILIFAVFACLLWVLGRPGGALRQGGEAREAQEVEEVQEQEMERQELPEGPADLRDSPAVRVVFEVTEVEEEPIADIIWLKKAASVALEQGSPYFNVLEQHFIKKFNPEWNMRLTTVEGIIQLTPDSMGAEYDAHEIDSLILTDYQE